jgi:hypothetical protein
MEIVMLYVDIPTTDDLKLLISHRDDICLSIYLRTSPVTRETAGDRIELKNLTKQGIHQLDAAGADKRRIAALAEHLGVLSTMTSSGDSRRAASLCWRRPTISGLFVFPTR